MFIESVRLPAGVPDVWPFTMEPVRHLAGHGLTFDRALPALKDQVIGSQRIIRNSGPNRPSAIALPLAGVIEDNLPSLGPFAPDERKNPIVLFGLATRSAVEMELPCDQRDLRFTAA